MNQHHQQLQNVHMEISQQPREALVTTDGKEKVRKPIDPPPIVKLGVSKDIDPNQQFLQSPYLFMTCSLVSNDEQNTPVKHANGKAALSGSLTSSLHRLKDTENIDGAYFVFGDVSCKETGMHRLKFCLYDLHKETKEAHFLGTITSDTFNVVQSKDFHGLEESTYLSRAFSDQGVRLRLRKEPRTRQHGSTKRSYSTYNGMTASPGHSQHEAGYDFETDASPNSEPKRHRGISTTHQQHGYTYPVQPVRTPENSTFPQQRQPFLPGGYPTSFSFSRPQMAPSSFVGATGPSNGSPFDTSLMGYEYPSTQQRSILESPHRPHGIGHFSQGSVQQDLREEEAAGSLQSLAVQASNSGSVPGHSMYMQDHVNHPFSAEIVDPALMEPTRPTSRYMEQVQHQIADLKSAPKQDDKSEASVQIPSDQFYVNGY
ncbi:hypothetical protein FKW77_006059 [Venturia effusa]|uniref:Velvet domain-containing protein n=1 Tax=Venturia effusa TaxID=50376 RepID=A0A517LHB6_9PEZI|nr:hypothetical protein FKW77_006059 [Venturia effusa]